MGDIWYSRSDGIFVGFSLDKIALARLVMLKLIRGKT
jgi:hypothetical protein